MNLLLYFPVLSLCDKWAILIAGSSSFKNYRHQSDVFTLYQILTLRGFPKDHIITFAYDDIALDSHNPTKGEIYNEAKGVNVYPGSDAISYRGKNVTVSNVFDCLLGKSTFGPNLLSTSNDDVLIYFNDHGAPGTLALPRIDPDNSKMFANELNDVLQEMNNQKKFKKLLFVIEACESGSVGEVIQVPNVLTITASNALESSRAYKWDDEMETFLSNIFTFYLFDFICHNSNKTIHDLYNFTKGKTFKSEVCYFGDKEILNMNVSDFFGKANGQFPLRNSQKYTVKKNGKHFGTASKIVFLSILKRKLKKSSDENEKKRLTKAINNEQIKRKKSDESYQTLLSQMMPNKKSKSNTAKSLKTQILDWKCYKEAVIGAEKLTGPYKEYSYKNLWAFAKLCNHYHNSETILNNFKKIIKANNSVN
ncbi:Hemoglobinase [Tritrichomonas foetus]|uniref:Hemoglobinase n=1 Tax=Tritrichomonas foetus TaxID=1144522 RepID=A0A1J4JKF0_9EUKA|nr:Hemoglobinase [Tritrichomonas foetus]|eukprot:OHS98871.1 Hemoglobinase [Tritrichomonas foetus]